MILNTDPDLEIAVSFFERNFPTSKLVPLVDELQKLAPIMWGRYEIEPIAPTVLDVISAAVQKPTAAR